MVQLSGSERPALGTVLGEVPADETASVTLVLRRRSELPTVTGGALLTAAELGERHGAHPDDLAAVREAVEAAGLRVDEAHGPSRRVRVSGPVPALAAAFGVRLQRAEVDGRTIRMRSGPLSVPAALDEVVLAVLGLDDRPQATPRMVRAEASATSRSYTPVELAEVYAMPAADGSGQVIAVIELGGGYADADLHSYFGGLGLGTPSVTAVGVDGAVNVPGQDPQGADGEVLLDIEVAGAVAPAASIVVYFAPNTDAGFLDAVATAAHATPTPTAMSISWGQSEDQWTAQARTAMDQAFADAAALGVTVTAAAGDNGSGDSDTSPPGAHADFPASSPHVLGCGGTSLDASGATVVSETVWDDGGAGGATGGGVSDAFALPSWQSAAGVPARSGGGASGRGVPDVAGDADPATGYAVLVDGSRMVIGGTSAVAPLWAGLVARIAQLTGARLGLLQPRLYAGVAPGRAAPGLRDITSGSNGAYAAGPGWDPCTGLGVPSSGTGSLFGL